MRKHTSRALAVRLAAALLLATSARSGSLAQAPAGPLQFPEYGLTLTLPPLDGYAADTRATGQLKGRWTGKLGPVALDISLWLLPSQKFRLQEPEGVLDLVQENVTGASAGGGAEFTFGKSRALAGNYGWAAYAVLAQGELLQQEASRTVGIGRLYVLAGLLEKNGYALQVECKPAPGEAESKQIEAFLETGLVYQGAARDPKWTEDEVQARWQRDAPPEVLDELESLIRTEHYVILGNSSGGKLFAKKMEECYAAIQKVYPFEEVKGRKLMPVFLFQNAEEYYAFFARRTGIALEQAKKSKGHAWRDYYATWYEAPGDLVHIHEATHQIFGNRLYLDGGGSWLQEGVAEYMSTKPNDRNEVARLVKKERHTKLAEFVGIPSLLMSAQSDIKGGNEAGDHYKQAALLIEFLRDGKWKPEKFQAFLHAVGRVKRNAKPAIEKAVQAVYGVDLAGLEQEWVAWAKKR